MSLRNKILNVQDTLTELVDVPEWDTKIEVRGMSGKDRVDFYARVVSDGETDRETFIPELIISTCFDPDTGDRLFEPADRDTLNTKSGKALTRLFKVASRLSGIGEEEEETAAGKSGTESSDGS